MANYYALNLNFDPTSSSGLFQPDNSSGNSGRAWWVSPPQDPWNFAGNPDTFSPVLSLAGGDHVQFAVAASTTPATPIASVALTVIFSTDRAAAHNPARIASPFQLTDGNARCVLNDSTKLYKPSNSNVTWYFIGPYPLAINQANSGRGRLKFEFAVAAHVTFQDGTVTEYGYDPEMDVDV
jgi:hypothetical protein